MRVQCVSETRITTSVYVALGDLCCLSLTHTHTLPVALRGSSTWVHSGLTSVMAGAVERDPLLPVFSYVCMYVCMHKYKHTHTLTHTQVYVHRNATLSLILL